MKVFYHGNCPDGLTAAAVANYHFKRARFKNLEYYPLIHGYPMSFDKIEENDNVLILDHSIHPDEMKELLKITKNVTWIDHHKSAIRLYKDFPRRIKGKRSEFRSGAYLTWEYLAPQEVIPDVVRLVDDHDRWVYEMDGSRGIGLALQVVSGGDPTNPAVWNELMENHPDAIKEMKVLADTIVNYEDMRIEQMAANAYKLKFEGYDFIVLNKYGGSDDFKYNDLTDVHGMMLWSYNGDFYKFSLRLTDKGRAEGVDLLKIATKYKGGGHHEANGFEVREWPDTLIIK